MADNVAMSFAAPNYSGMLFNKGNTKTPLSSMIGAKPKFTNHVEFTTGQYYTTGGGSQPEISESASLTAPEATFITRSQMTNNTQIFQETVYVSYGKQSNMGTMSGINVAGQQANPIDELDFQVVARMQKIAADIEYTFINGVYQKATTDAEANKTRGLIPAITTNVETMGDAPLTYWAVARLMKAIHDQNAPTDNLVLGVNATTLLQLNFDAQANKLTIVPNARNINGISVDVVITPLGAVAVRLLEYLPADVAVLFDPSIMAPVYQPTPRMGNFFLEELAKTGAGTKYQIFGQVGLDHGPEWYSAKFTGISTDLPEGNPSQSVIITNPTTNPVKTKEVAGE